MQKNLQIKVTIHCLKKKRSNNNNFWNLLKGSPTWCVIIGYIFHKYLYLLGIKQMALKNDCKW